MADSKKIDDIVAMIDNFMANGGGQMNVDVENNTENLDKQVSTTNSSDCSGRETACMVPTLHQGLDRDE